MTDRPASEPGPPTCRFCGAPLGRSQATSGDCGAPACETRRVQQAARAFYKRGWDDFVEHQVAGIDRAGGALVRAARMLGVEPAAMPVGIVPRQNRPLAPLPAARRAAFLANLVASVEASFAAGHPAAGSGRDRGSETAEPLVTGLACAVCQGHCCTLGGETHAFQTKASIDDFRRRHPDLDQGAVIAHFRDAIPGRSVAHSCVYHGPAGCVLAREDRASVCNSYQCNQKSQLIGRLRAAGGDRVAWVAHGGDGAPAVAVIDPGNGPRPVPPGNAGVTEAEIEAARRAARATLPEKLPPA